MRPMRTIALLAAATMISAAVLPAQTRRGGPRGMRPGGGSLNNPPKANSEAEKRILEVAEQVERYLNVPSDDGRLIRILTEAVGAKRAIEIGTSTGYSGLWFSLALLKTGGTLTTFEYDEGRAATARENFRKAGVEKIVTVIVGDAHETVKQVSGPVDIVFIDADKPGYRDYLDKILPLLRPGGLILAHNINGRESNPEYVDAVVENPALDTILMNGQMTVTLKKR